MSPCILAMEKKVTQEMNVGLIKEFTVEEVSVALNQMSQTEMDPLQSIWTGEYPVFVLSGALLSKFFLLDNNALNNARTGSHPVQMDWRGSQ